MVGGGRGGSFSLMVDKALGIHMYGKHSILVSGGIIKFVPVLDLL